MEMDKYAKSIDGIDIHCKITDTKPIAIVFVHGWLGNSEWWKNQQNYFERKYTLVQIDLPGHGKSMAVRKAFSSGQYADDIKTVIDQIESSEVVLVGGLCPGGL
jgi:pimeloyl-ACP methyl ester carboxylesterase